MLKDDVRVVTDSVGVRVVTDSVGVLLSLLPSLVCRKIPFLLGSDWVAMIGAG